MLGAGALLTPWAAAAAPKSQLLDPSWRKTGSGGDPDYADWAGFLSTYAKLGGDGIVYVDYARAKRDGGHAKLAFWLMSAESVDPTTLAPDAQFAWWVNLYNARTVELVLKAFPVESIMEVEGGLFNTGPWGEDVFEINGVKLSLDDVEHGILRPIFGDERVHYAVNCASIGCPNLATTPWTSAGLSARLDKAARDYVNHPRGATVSGGKLTVSKIYTWFQEDFGGDDAGVIAHLKAHADAPLASALNGVSKISDEVYDWSLNGV